METTPTLTKGSDPHEHQWELVYVQEPDARGIMPIYAIYRCPVCGAQLVKEYPIR